MIGAAVFPRTSHERENPTWGYTRLLGALYNLGHEVARNTIKNTLLAHGLEPAPERGRRTSWHTFIKSHLGAIAGADFFTVEVLRGFGLTRAWTIASSNHLRQMPTHAAALFDGMSVWVAS